MLRNYCNYCIRLFINTFKAMIYNNDLDYIAYGEELTPEQFEDRYDDLNNLYCEYHLYCESCKDEPVSFVVWLHTDISDNYDDDLPF